MAGVIILMAMESSIFPVPSEVVIPPAAILSAQPDAPMSFWGVVLAGTFGSWLGSAITYVVARVVGRPVIMRWGKFFFMPPHKVEKAELFLQRYEVSGVFFARLLPVIRHLISIPAGIVRMGFGVFSLSPRSAPSPGAPCSPGTATGSANGIRNCSSPLKN